MQEYKCRASSAGNLMIATRSKTELLSKTTQSYLETWMKEQIYGVKQNIKSKYLSKGTELEDEAISLAVEYGIMPFTVKNEKQFEDSFFTGTPDIITEDAIYDTKCSWDCFTFPLFDEELPEKNYFYQMQVYMHLTGKKKAYVVFMLLNTPEDLPWGDFFDYSKIEPKFRHKIFEVNYDPEIIKELQEKVILSRNYINSKIKKL